MIMLIASAFAVSPTAEWNGWATDLEQRIEENTHRRYRVHPDLVVGSEDKGLEVIANFGERWRTLGGEYPIPGSLPPGIMALYSPIDQRIYVFTDRIEGVLSRYHATDDLHRPFLQCVLAHELTHALQDQYLPPRNGSDAVWAALQEGHATLVARHVCEDNRAATFSETAMGNDVASSVSPADEQGFQYVYGTRYMERVEATGGTDAMWGVFSAPPSREQMITDIQAVLMTGWTHTEPLKTVIEGLYAKYNPFPGVVPVRKEGASSAVATLAALQDGNLDASDLMRTEAGLTASVDSGTTSVSASVWRVQNAQQIGNWLEKRGTMVKTGNMWLRSRQVPYVDGGITSPSKALWRWGAEYSLRFYFWSMSNRYMEVWACHNGVLANVTAYAEKPTFAELETKVESLLGAYSSQIPPIAPLSVAPPAASTEMSPAYLIDRARRFLVEEGPGGCARRLSELGGAPEICDTVIEKGSIKAEKGQ